MKRFIVSLLVCCSFPFVPLAQAQSARIDSIIAIVDDDVITQAELSREVSRIRDEYRIKGRDLLISESLNRQILELMINKSILLQEAERRGISVTETQLNSTMQNLAQRNNKTLAEFRQALLDNGMDYIEFREDVKKEMIINTIRDSYARQNIDISDQEVNDFMKRGGVDADSVEYRLAHILIAVPDGASTEQINSAKNRANEIIQQLRDGEDFSQLATQNSAGGNALEGGDLGWRKLAEIPSLFSELVQHMAVGQISEALRSASGFHIVRLEDRRDSEQVIVQQIHARHILIKPDTLTTDDQARQQLETVREEFLQGADFAELARQYSDDPGSKGLGGDLGWFNKGSMVPAFEKMLETTKTGETSVVFRSRFGWHFLQVLGTKKVDETEEIKRNKIREQLGTQKKTEVLELWQKRLRDEAFVKIFES